MKNEFDLSWFDLSKYDAVKDFDAYEWYSHLKLRQVLQCLEFKSHDIPSYIVEILREIKKQPLSIRSYDIGEWSAVTEATYMDFIWANNNNPNSKDLYDLLGFLLTNEDTGEMGKSYEISVDKDRMIESDGFYSRLEQVISNDRPVLSVDLSVSDEQLTYNFTRWLKEKRVQMGNMPRRKMFRSNDFDRWEKHKILPYLDLTLIASSERKELTQNYIGKNLFPSDYDVDLTQKIRQQVKPLADLLITSEVLSVLRSSERDRDIKK